MNQKYILLLKKYLSNQLTYDEQYQFELTIVNNISLCEDLKNSSNIPEHTFVKMYYAIKEKLKYRIDCA